MTTRNEMTAMIDAARGEDGYRFYGDYAAVYDLSDDELDRILERANTAEEFERIWENEIWWVDADRAI